MKCANCGAEIKVGCIYCSVCGKEAQIVSDYNLLEDDFLRNVLKEKEEKAAEKTSRELLEKEKNDKEISKSHASQGGKKGKGNRKRKKRLIFAGTAIILLVILIVSMVLIVNYGQEHSYDYQMEQAKAFQKEMNYRQAEKHVKRALELEGDSLEANLTLADIYLLQGEEKQALSLLEKLRKEHKDNLEIHQKLIQIYDEKKDFESIHVLSETVDDMEVSKLFSKYVPEPPEFDIPEGIYEEAVSVRIMAQEGCEVYFTIDGSDPTQGIRYENPILIEPGQELQIRAIACNTYGIYSEEIEASFKVQIPIPEIPQVSPSGGSFYMPQEIYVKVPTGCKVYYTWDGTEPTVNSQQYTQPLTMPEGNNILSLVLVNQYGKSSNVLRCNYIYIP